MMIMHLSNINQQASLLAWYLDGPDGPERQYLRLDPDYKMARGKSRCVGTPGWFLFVHGGGSPPDLMAGATHFESLRPQVLTPPVYGAVCQVFDV